MTWVHDVADALSSPMMGNAKLSDEQFISVLATICKKQIDKDWSGISDEARRGWAIQEAQKMVAAVRTIR